MASKTQSAVIDSDQIKIMVQPEQPWLLLNGKHTPENQLKKLTPFWDTATWDRYLIWFETPRAESLLTPGKYIKACEEDEESIFVNAQSDADAKLRAEVNELLESLTQLESKVIRLIFWDGRSERFVANHLKLSRSTIKDAKKRALKRIKLILKTHTPSSRNMKGKVEFASLTTGVSNGATDLAKGEIRKAS
jgi:RNA polymerase sigma factor (sigma-70 family)